MYLPLLLAALPVLGASGQACTCQYKSQCQSQFDTMAEADQSACRLPGGEQGHCCSVLGPSRPARKMAPLVSQDLRRPDRQVSEADIGVSLRAALTPSKMQAKRGYSQRGHNQFTKPNKVDKGLVEANLKLFRLEQKFNLRQVGVGLDSENSEEIDRICPWTNARRPRCDARDRFRTVDGSCNNLENPLFGAQGTPFQRILEATYHKRGNTPRKAQDGSELPSARKVSQTIFTADNGEDRSRDISSMLMIMGQFIDHDLTHTPNPVDPDRIPECCLPDRLDRAWIYPSDPFNDQPDECFPIEVLRNDSFWGRRGRGCMALSRSNTVPTVFPSVCESGRWEQENAITHWLDGSNIYGSTRAESEDVRDQQDRGLLATSAENLLPTCEAAEARGRDPESCCDPIGCTFVGGDLRANENPMLTVQHTVWVREHNRVAAELKLVNPGWRGERLFQETRRIVIAEWQHIVYNEWLPIVIGTSYLRTFNLQPLTSGYSLDYDPDFDPRINNEFATAAFRFGHTLITPNVPERDERGRNTTQLDLRNLFSMSQQLENRDFIEDVTRGLSQSKIPPFDGNFVDDVINHLFEGEGGEGLDGGLDLTALNIQRAREHGIPGYNQYREICASSITNFKKVSSIRQFTQGGWLSLGDVNNLREV